MALNTGFVVVQVVFGLLAGSMALLADAGHNAGDVLALGAAWIGFNLARTMATRRRTYGLRKSPALAALFNAMMLLVATGAILWESVRRLANPQEVDGMTMIWVAALGIVINASTAMLFFRDRRHDINIRGAYLHMMSDAAVSLGVLISGWAILATGLGWIDPAVSVLISLVIVVSAWGLLRESVLMVVDAVPAHIDLRHVEDYLRGVNGVDDIHDLHVWSLSTTETAMTVHLVCPMVQDTDSVLEEVQEGLHEKFGIVHATLQIERVICDAPCIVPSPMQAKEG